MSGELPRVTFRVDEVGGDVGDAKGKLPGLSHVVLLIHGYNNTLEFAEKAYDGFVAVQRGLAGDPDGPVGGGRLVEIFWPGDSRPEATSALFYAASLDKAKDTAERLAAMLVDASLLNDYLVVDIVAHSMGCRLALEVMRRLSDGEHGNVHLRRVVLMAGAVPLQKLADADAYESLRPAFDTFLEQGARSLYSRDDMVLALAFPLGQSTCGQGEGFLPTALGHDLWADPYLPPHLSQLPVEHAGHGDYWGWNEKTLECARAAGRIVHDYLQFPEAIERDDMRRDIAARPTPEIEPPADRDIVERA